MTGADPRPVRERHGVDLRFFCSALRWLVRRYGDCPARGDEIEELRQHLEKAESVYRRLVEAEPTLPAKQSEPPAGAPTPAPSAPKETSHDSPASD